LSYIIRLKTVIPSVLALPKVITRKLR